MAATRRVRRELQKLREWPALREWREWREWLALRGKCSFAAPTGQRRCVFGSKNVVLLTSLVSGDAFLGPKR
ncbi:hypothetical protein BIFGAL_04161 [Bifidobacterium gallicum DSM 20093 = LMG 11596]|uniref:Uncharacterized protein n=1 Tax=Bifidobacterium gallicum DSM 20093 = LMG 11596 TaxID=561180 RepID=D1NWB4_9BIFI|nr:hypothetical protein BIFGAL_04161 [Bifidobacterium gallicum DSM 20093 = LMG 11596]